MEIFNYNGHNITFDFGNDAKMVNATEMGKPFGKRATDFLKTEQTQRFIEALSQSADLHLEKIVKTVHGGAHRGTWLHEKLALKFAAYLSPEFELWVYDRIHELLTTGKTELQSLSPAELLHQITAQMVAQEKRTLALEANQQEQEKRLLEVEAKVSTRNEDYYTVAGYAGLIGKKISFTQTQALGKRATALSSELGYEKDTVKDARYTRVGSYHTDILKQVFDKFFTTKK